MTGLEPPSMESEDSGGDFSDVWNNYVSFEAYKRSRGARLGPFLSQWMDKMSVAQAAGCHYSEILLACKLLEKANLNKEEIQNIVHSIQNSRSGVLSIMMSRLEAFSVEETVVGEEDYFSDLGNGMFDKDQPSDNDQDVAIKEESTEKMSSSKKFLAVKDQRAQDGRDQPRCPNCSDPLDTILINKKGEKKKGKLVCASCNYEMHLSKIFEQKSPQPTCLEDAVGADDNLPSDMEIKDEPYENPQSFLDITITDIIRDEAKLKNDDDPTPKKRRKKNDLKKHTCDICGKIFDRPWRLTDHLVKRHGPENHDDEYEDDKEIKSESESHGKSLKLANGMSCQCEYCGKKFPRKSQLKKHYDRFHNPVEDSIVNQDGAEVKKVKKQSGGPCQCEFCGEKFPRIIRLKQHYDRCPVIGKEGADSQGGPGRSRSTTTCKFCNKTFARPYNYRVHLPLHTGERNFKCDICPATFTHYVYLSYHKKKHTGERPHKCDQCTKSFLTTTNLKLHMRRVHTNERPYQCDQCSYRTASKYHLSRHILTHTGERPYKCTLCDKTYRENKSRKRHMKAHHAQSDMHSMAGGPDQLTMFADFKMKAESQ